MGGHILLPILLLLPLLCAGLCLALRKPRSILVFTAGGTVAIALLSACAVVPVFRGAALLAAGDWLRLDALSAIHLAVMMAVFSLSSLFAIGFFEEEARAGWFSRAQARRYGALWFGALMAMMLVLLSNNLGLLWVGIEASTLLTAFLICIHAQPNALEAMWKYLLMCSVGVALAFVGTLLLAAAATPADVAGTDMLLWTRLYAVAGQLDPALLKAGFLFLVVGYGTKAGLAPLHNWLPDAHSQAPAPISALFSGFLLNAALYGILRCLPLVDHALGQSGWGHGVLLAFGGLSVLVAAAFVVGQRDLKRLLAYSSVEHMGMIALGVGLGGFGAVAGLWHMMNHSLGKTLAFCSAGRLGQLYGTHDIHSMAGAMRRSRGWAVGLVGSLLALIGATPFAIFLSKFFILKAALDRGAYGIAALFLACVAVVFVCILHRVIAIAWGPDTSGLETRQKATPLEMGLITVPLIVLLALGVWLPAPLLQFMERAAGLLRGVP